MEERSFQEALRRLNAGAMTREEFSRTFGAPPEHASVPIIGASMSPREMFGMLMSVINHLAKELRGDLGPPWLVHPGPVVPEQSRGFINITVDPRWLGLVPWS